MNTSLKNQPIFYRFLLLALLLGSGLLTACFGPKNLVTKQRDMPSYAFMGDTLSGWALVRQDSLWGYASAEGKRAIVPRIRWAGALTAGMAQAKARRGYRHLTGQAKLVRRV